MHQDIEPDPTSGGRRIKQEVAKDRIISISDPEMRHGRKSKTKLFNGYKRHIAIANSLILATAVEPANVQEHEPAAGLLERVAQHGIVEIVDIDRGYLASAAIAALFEQGATINSRPWVPTNKGLFTKLDFRIDARRRIVRIVWIVTLPQREKRATGRQRKGNLCRRGLLAMQAQAVVHDVCEPLGSE